MTGRENNSLEGRKGTPVCLVALALLAWLEDSFPQLREKAAPPSCRCVAVPIALAMVAAFFFTMPAFLLSTGAARAAFSLA